MHDEQLRDWQHSHCFGQDVRRPGERRALLVIAITASMMVVEIAAGLGFRSMALLAEGLHMASHTAALSISAFAYLYARRHASDARYSFGTGKVNALGGFAGAVLLAAFVLLMFAWSLDRLFHPVRIALTYAIVVALLGLLVNAVCVVILNVRGADHAGDGGHLDSHYVAHAQDHNLRAAYLHVLADALTAVLAVIALLAAKYLGLTWIDPVMGIVGAVLVARWSLGLLRTTSAVLLDRQAPDSVRERIAQAIEADGDSRVADLHVWSIGPGLRAAEMTVVAHAPVSSSEYAARMPRDIGLAHISIETHECAASPAGYRKVGV
jgi:cation diffusion facilitator family transporter